MEDLLCQGAGGDCLVGGKVSFKEENYCEVSVLRLKIY